ncbi:MAG: ATP-binding cassette domain-containing protein [Pseudomonadota bacterium]
MLEHAELSISKGERLCISGRNGTGKSTLLKLIAGDLQPDGGSVWRQPGLKVSVLEQTLPEGSAQTVFDVVSQAFAGTGEILRRYHHLLQEMETGSFTEAKQAELGRVQQKLDHADAWSFSHLIERVLDRFKLDGNATLDSLSGGWRRRVTMAKSLVTEPDLWLLDEPTNHLDIPTIEWLERELNEFDGTLVFVTHDRRLMQQVATSIVDIDRGLLTRWDCDYESFLTRRAHQLEVEAVHNREFDKRLRKEEAWIRQGIQARRTRNEGRVRALEKMRLERQGRREAKSLKLEADSGSRSGKLVKVLEGVSKSYGDRCVIRDLDLIIQRGDRLGILGPNGAGKSTLLRILLGETAPDAGSVSTGTKLDVAYFDQVRAQIDPEQTVADTISDGREYVEINGRNVHVVTWLANFMFTPDQARAPVRVLSGGEQNRLLLAKLFSLPANLLVMDEPTNDLDVESLELLEELLIDYQGTVLLVTHDRSFLDNVVSSLLVFEGDGRITEYVGGYTDWRSGGGSFDGWHGGHESGLARGAVVSTTSFAEKKQEKRDRQKRERELAALPDLIDRKEQALAQLHGLLAAADFHEKPAAEQARLTQALQSAESELATLFARWEQLESEEG